jgi:DNA polymerase-1
MLVSADFSQIELRLLAHLSGDALLVAAFREGADVHRRTAAEIFGVAPEEVTTAQRETGKTVNFATLYGQGATALARSLGIARPEAKAIIERTFRAYAGVRAWIDRTIEESHARGGCVSLLGRPRPVPELSSADPTVRSYGERVAVNNTVQGSAADLSMVALLAVARRIREAGLGARPLVLVHDELLLDAPEAEVDRTIPIVKAAMEGCYRLVVPLVVTTGAGATWAAAK